MWNFQDLGGGVLVIRAMGIGAMSSVAKVFRILETVVSHQARGLAYS